MPVHEGGTAVVHPPHYNRDPSGVECIEIVRHRNFNIGSAIKYLWRHGLKVGSGGGDSVKAKAVEDLNKARYYIADEIERIGGVVEEREPGSKVPTYQDVADWLESGSGLGGITGNSLLASRIREVFGPKEEPGLGYSK